MSFKSLWEVDDSEEPPRRRIIETSTSSSIKLHNNVVKGCVSCGLSKPNKVQQQVLSHFSQLCPQNLVIIAPPRAGKTSSAVITILNSFSRATSKYSLAIIICPTYEIAEIFHSCCQVLARYCDIFLHFTVKGKRLNKGDKHPKEIIIGTPDKILDLSRASLIELKKASYLVIDEADCLGNPRKFFSDVSQICERLSTKCFSILCTVAKNRAIEDFVAKRMDLSVEISVTDSMYRQFPIKQLYLTCTDEKEKVESLTFLVKMQHFRGKMIVFAETKEVVNNLGLLLHQNNITTVLLIGDLSVSQRKAVIEDFKTGTVQVLITTRSFVSVIPSCCATKLIHYDQILDERDRLDTNVYIRREYLLSTKNKCLNVYYIEKRYEEYLFKDKEVINDKSFFNQIEIVNSSKLMEYFS